MPLRAVVRLSLLLLRVASHATFFLEAQRLLLRLVRPIAPRHLHAAERQLLSTVRVPLRHLFVRDGRGNSIHVIHAAAAPSTSLKPLHQHQQQQRHAVLLHGHSMSAAFWYRNFDHLVAAGYSVWAVDLLGWGRSARPSFRGSSALDAIQWFLHSLSAVLDALQLPTFTLVGHSLGAYLSIEYTKLNPKRVDHLVLVSPAAALRPVPLRRALYFWLPPQSIVRRGGLLGFLLFALKYPRHEMYVRDRLREYTYHLAVQSPPSGETAIRPIIRFRGLARAECARPIVEFLSVFHTPVRIVCGRHDSSIRVQDVFALFERMKRMGFCVKMNVVEECDHCPMLEKPAEFSAIMNAVMKSTQRSTF